MTTRLPLDWRFFLLLVGLGCLGTQVSLFDLDEGAFLEATRELLAGGHWAATTLDGEPRYDKPILTYWLQAASLTLLSGLSPWLSIELIGRLPSVLAGAVWAWVLGRYVAEQQPQKGVFISLVVATSLGVIVIARAATADALLNLWFALLFVDISRCIREERDGPRLRVYLWLSLGILTKGPVAILIPGGALMLWTLASQQWRWLMWALAYPTGWALLAAILAPWLIGIYDAQGLDFWREFIFRHNLERFTGNLHGHGGHPLYYLFVMPLMLLPYSALVLAILWQAPTLWRNPLTRFGLVWLGLVVLLVSASGTQLPHYVLYSTPSLFVLYGHLIGRLSSRIWAIPGLIIPAGLLLALFNHHAWPQPTHARDIEQLLLLADVILQWESHVIWGLGILTGIACLLILWPKVPLEARLLGLGGVQLATITLIVLPLLATARQDPLKDAALLARHAGAEVVSQGVRMPSFSFYRGAITREQAPTPGQWVLIAVHRVPELGTQSATLELKASGPGWRLIALVPPSAI